MTAKTFTPTYELLCCPTCLLPKERCCCQKQVSEELEGKIILPSFNPHWMVHTERSTWNDNPENHYVSEATLECQNEELKKKASSPEDFEAELKRKKRRGDDVKWEEIREVKKPTHRFPKFLYHEGRTGVTYSKRHHTDCCGTDCPSKTSGYCLYQKMFGYCSARRDALDEKELREHGRRCRHACNHCCLTKRLAFEPLCREEDYGQYRGCGYIPQNGGLPIVTAYFGRQGLGYEGDSELVFNQEEGRIQSFDEAFSSFPEPEEDSVHMCETKITFIKKEIAPSLPPREQKQIIKNHKPPLLYTSARTVPLSYPAGSSIRHIGQIPISKPIKSYPWVSSCIIC